MFLSFSYGVSILWDPHPGIEPPAKRPQHLAIQRVPNQSSLFAHRNQTDTPQYPQVPGKQWLTDTHCLDQFGDTHFLALGQLPQNL